MKQLVKKNSIDIVFYVIFSICLIALYIKRKYGFGEVDEPLVLSIPYRIVNGDVLFKDEWNLSQMAAILQYPLMKLYTILHNDTIGIILWYRTVYVIVQAVLSIILFYRIKRISKGAAVFFSIFFLLFAPANIMQLYYNSLCFIFVTFIVLGLYDKSIQKNAFVYGIMLAAAVLCNPYLVLLFVYINLLLFLDKEIIDSQKKLRVVIQFNAGILLLFVIWCIFIFSKISINDFLNNLYFIIVGDAGHTSGLSKKPITFLIETLLVYKGTLVACAIYFFILLLGLKNNKKYNKLAIIVCIIHIFTCIDWRTYNPASLSLSIALLGLYLIIANWEKSTRNILLYIWLPGFLYAFVNHLASDNGISTISIACGVIILAACIYLSSNEDDNEKNCSVINKLSLVLYTSFLLVLFCMRIYGVYWNDPITFQKVKISEGPEKGIIASEEKAKDYEIIYSEVNQLDTSKKTLFFTSRTWLYLVDGFENCSYSAWIWHISEDTVKRFETYYEINPDKKPEIVYIDYVNADLVNSWEDYGYSIKEKTPSGGYVLEAQ